MKSTILNTVPAQEVKRRGVRAILDRLEAGPVHVVQHNRPAFVALDEQDFRELVEEVEEARLRASLQDIEAGRARFGSARELFDELVGDEDSADAAER